MKYKDAFLFGTDYMPGWFMDKLTAGIVILHCDNEDNRGPFEECINQTATIKTPKGDHTAAQGDYIVCGVDGEIYSCNTENFHMNCELDCD